jgi:hypothetical protein
MELAVSVESSTVSDESTPTLINNTKGNRYYYKHREKILEKRRIERLVKKGVDVTKLDRETNVLKEEIIKKKLQILGLALGEENSCT